MLDDWVSFLGGANFSRRHHCDHTGSGIHEVSCPTGVQACFPGGETAED
jgi:hypothetical protein